MSSKASLGPAFKDKIAILIAGVVVLALGLFSHFQSTWVKSVSFYYGVIKMYQICDLKYVDEYFFDEDYPKCPSIALEHYFVIMIILCFVLSLVNLIVGFVADLKSAPLKWVDFAFHLISSVMLLVAGAVYIYSAFQINKYVWGEEGEPDGDLYPHINFRRWEKVGAGGLTIVQALLYGYVALGLK